MESVEYRNIRGLEETDLLIIPCSGQGKSKMLNEIDRMLDGGATLRMRQTSFRAALGEICKLTTNGKFPVAEILLAGTGSAPGGEIQMLGGQIAGYLDNARTVAIDCTADEAKELFLGLSLGSFFPKAQKKRADRKEIKWICLSERPEETKLAFQETECLLEGVFLARELAYLPANLLPPMEFARRCGELARLGLEVEIFGKNALSEIGLEAILSVGKGSVNSPCVVTIRWNGADEDPIAFVGKGVCFDSGGINIKTENLLEMKWDKAGAAAVIGLMAALAKANAKVNAIAVIGLVENMVDGGALKPGDVIGTKGGLSVEVVDTDNEGRLVLCDCISFVQEIAAPSLIIDLGTLTLETFGALAGEYAGLFCNDDRLQNELQQAGRLTGEKLWPLPMGQAFAKQLESDAADIKNSGILGFGECGAAAEFLRAFVKPGVKWAHLDISGVAWTTQDTPLNRKGVSGFGVRLLYEWVKSNNSPDGKLKALSKNPCLKEAELAR